MTSSSVKVRLPDGRVVANVPRGTTREALAQRLDPDRRPKPPPPPPPVVHVTIPPEQLAEALRQVPLQVEVEASPVTAEDIAAALAQVPLSVEVSAPSVEVDVPAEVHLSEEDRDLLRAALTPTAPDDKKTVITVAVSKRDGAGMIQEFKVLRG